MNMPSKALHSEPCARRKKENLGKGGSYLRRRTVISFAKVDASEQDRPRSKGSPERSGSYVRK